MGNRSVDKLQDYEAQISQLEQECTNFADIYAEERKNCEMRDVKLRNLLEEITDVKRSDIDFLEDLAALKSFIKASKQSKKQDEIDRENNSNETKKLKALVAEKDKEIKELKKNADSCKKSAEKADAEKLKLSSRLSAITTELEQAQKINERFVANHTDMEQKISKLKRQLDVHSQNDDVVSFCHT